MSYIDYIWARLLALIPNRRLHDEVIRRNRLGSMRRHPSKGNVAMFPDRRGQSRPPRVVQP